MVFDTFATQAGQASLDALWMRGQVLTSNLANSDTPNYKAKDITFSQVLNKAKDDRVRASASGTPASGGASYRIKSVENSSTSVRVDGNNVDVEREQSELWKTYAQYNAVMDYMKSHYNSINTLISSMRG